MNFEISIFGEIEISVKFQRNFNFPVKIEISIINLKIARVTILRLKKIKFNIFLTCDLTFDLT